MVKEIFFVFVVFWYVASINNKADNLTKKLSEDIWDSECVTLRDVQRLSTHASAVSNPITFTLLFRRLNFDNAILSIGGFILSIVGSLIKLSLGI